MEGSSLWTLERGLVFVFERETGKPLFEIEERKAPASRVPGEHAWPTQPFPLKPPPLTRHTMTADEITNVTPESRQECLQILKDARIGDFYEPPGLDFTIIFPGTNGGPNWGGASYDPVSNLLFVNSMDVGEVMKLVKAGTQGAVGNAHRNRSEHWKISKEMDISMNACGRAIDRGKCPSSVTSVTRSVSSPDQLSRGVQGNPTCLLGL